MKFWEALRLMQDEGKKIRRPSWCSSEYIESCEDYTAFINHEDLSSTDWEVFEEPKPKKQVWLVARKKKYSDDYLVLNTLYDIDQIKYIESHGDFVLKLTGPFEVED